MGGTVMFRQIFQLSIKPALFAPWPCWRSLRLLLGPAQGLLGDAGRQQFAPTLHFKWGVGVDSASLKQNMKGKD